MITLRRGLDWTLVELNKAISLTALTALMLSFIPFQGVDAKQLYNLSLISLVLHSVYSIYKFYGFSIAQLLKEKKMKKVSLFLGSVCQVVLELGYLGYMPRNNLVYISVVVGLAHFWTMEIDFKYVLQVRPFAYLPFVVGPIVLCVAFMKIPLSPIPLVFL